MPPDPARAEAAGPRRDPPRHLPSRQTGRDHPGVTSVAMSGQGSVAASEVAPQSIHYLQVQTTTDSRAEAMELAREAVEQRLAACAQVAGPIASMYWWEEGIERAEEWLLMLDPGVFLLDEPTANLAPMIAASLLGEHVRSLAASGAAVLIVEQRAKAVLAISDRTYVLGGGEVRMEGTPAELSVNPEFVESFLGGRTRPVGSAEG